MIAHDYALRDYTVAGDGRTLTVACVPIGEPHPVTDDGATWYREMFAPGAFAGAIKAAWHRGEPRLRFTHTPDPINDLGPVLELREEPSMLVGDFRVAATDRGDHVLQLIEDGQYRSVSVGFEPGRTTTEGDLHTRHYIRRLDHVALTTAPQYATAEVLAVRDSHAQRRAQETERWRWLALSANLTPRT